MEEEGRKRKGDGKRRQTNRLRWIENRGDGKGMD